MDQKHLGSDMLVLLLSHETTERVWLLTELVLGEVVDGRIVLAELAQRAITENLLGRVGIRGFLIGSDGGCRVNDS